MDLLDGQNMVLRDDIGRPQHKPEVVDYCESFLDFLHLKVYAPKRKL